MGLRAVAETHRPFNPKATCAVRLVALDLAASPRVGPDGDTLTPDEWLAEVNDPSLTGRLDASVLEVTMAREYGIRVNQDSITRHRRGHCACPRPSEVPDVPA